MDPSHYDSSLLWLLLSIEVIQLAVIWGYLRQRYRLPLKQLEKLTTQLASREPIKSYYIDGPADISRMSRDLETVGLRLEDLQRLQQEENFNLNMLLANMVEGVMVVDERHEIRLVNDELLNLFRLKQSPLRRTVLESLRESRIELIVRETIESNEARQHEVTLESGTLGQPTRHFEVSAVPVRTKKGSVGGAVLVFHDITRIKQLEVVRREFVSNVSHELRTPLAIFRGYLETLLDNPGLRPEELKRMLETMQRHSNRLNALVEDLLMLTRIEAKQVESEFSTIRVDAFFSQIVQDWDKRRDTRAVTIERQIPADLPPLEVDELRFEQVMLNLIENAVAYSNEPRHVLLSAVVIDKEMEIRVTDNGIGIPAGDLPHIFERFYRVDKGRSRASGGTGLGLSIVKHTIQAHRGTVHAESEVGKGTSIVIRLPLSQESASG